MNKIILTADSTCDLNEYLIKTHNVDTLPYTIFLNDKDYKDNIDISPREIFDAYKKDKILPKTSSINTLEYKDRFAPLIDQGYKIIHVNLAASLTSSYSNCCIAAKELGNVYPIDSQNLSAGTGLLVLKAASLIKEGLDIDEINKVLKDHRKNIQMSFILDTLDFLYAGGRCSKVTSLSSNLLKIKPVIEVDNNSGAMSLGNKYRGNFEKTVIKYIKEKLSSFDNINQEHIFIVHTGIEEELINKSKDTILKYGNFKNIYVTTASCTISSHCGPNTLGIAFETQ